MGKGNAEPVKTEDSTLEQKNRDRIALVISILFVLAIGFLGYKFLNNSPNVKTAIYNVQQETKDNTNNAVENDIMASNTTRTETETDTSTDSETPAMVPQVAGTSDEAVVSVWEPTDYNSGDIASGSNYTVAEGDTLWEIAEAAYGNGADWVRILEANSGNIGYLANGQQSLIIPGQTLVIPVLN